MFCEPLFSFCNCLRIFSSSDKDMSKSTQSHLNRPYQSITAVLDNSFSNIDEGLTDTEGDSIFTEEDLAGLSNSDEDLVIIEPESIQDYKNDF